MGLSTDYAGMQLTRPAGRPRVRAAGGPAYGGRPTRRAGSRRRSSPAAGALRAGIGLSVLAIFLTGAGGVALDTAYAGRALPAVHFDAVPVGGLPADQVRSVLDPHLNSFLASPAVFVLGDREWRPAAAEMGVAVDSAVMAQDALQLGREGAWPLRYFGAVATAATKPSIPLRASLSQGQLAALLHAIAAEIDREPVNAGLQVRNGQLVTGQAAPGRKVDISATSERVSVPHSLTPQRVEVVVASTAPVVSDAAIQEAQSQAARILSAPLTLRLGDKTWTLTPVQLGAMLEFRRSSSTDGEKLTAVLSEPRLAAYVKTLAGEVDRPATDAQLRWNGGGATVVRASADGVRLDQPAAVRAIIAQATGEAREVTLPAAIARPAITSDPALVAGIKQLVATGTSKFAGSSPERLNNIQVAANRLDGAVIPPGATFSFLKALGPITKANGYQEGLTIQGDATVPGIGGGVCQVSTTVFRAAFYAGLPIVERHQHSYRVSYYEQDGSPVGFDAAVYDPGVDLRFRNDSEFAILMHAAVDTKSSTLAFRFYSTNTGREVKLTPQKANEIKAGPKLPDVLDPQLPKGTRKQVEWSADGVDATIRRIITNGAGGPTISSDAYFSRYVPWREKWAVGPP